MAARGPAQGTNMGSMQALNTSSSVNGATTWFLNQRISLTHSVQNQGSVGGAQAKLKTNSNHLSLLAERFISHILGEKTSINEMKTKKL